MMGGTIFIKTRFFIIDELGNSLPKQLISCPYLIGHRSAKLGYRSACQIVHYCHE